MKSRHLDWHRQNGPFHGKAVVRTNRASEGRGEPPLLAGQSGGSAILVRMWPAERAQTIGHIAALTVSSRSSRRSDCVRQVGGAYAGPGKRGCPVPRRSVGTATNRHDALAIHRGEHQTIRWRSTAKPDEIRQSRSS